LEIHPPKARKNPVMDPTWSEKKLLATNKLHTLAASLANAQDSTQHGEQNKFELRLDKKSNKSTKKKQKKAFKYTKI
ncbi:13949_t:CDS:1, partial [Dentiscutata heterogama]